MAKKVSFSKPERAKQASVDVDSWVASGSTEATEGKPTKARKGKSEPISQQVEEEITRFTIDIPVGLHTRIKTQCATRRVKMKEEIRSLLEKHFA